MYYGDSSVPRIPGIPISRIQARLAELFASVEMIWISGPRGSGRSTQLRHFLGGRSSPCVWIHANPGDRLAELLDSIGRQVSEHVAKAHPGARGSNRFCEDDRDPFDFVAEEFSALMGDLGPAATVVLDGMDGLDETTVVAAAELLLRISPKSVTWVVISSKTLPQGLTRLRFQQYLGVIEWADLRLRANEIRAVAEVQGIPRRHLDSVTVQVDGWVGGVSAWVNGQESCPDSPQLSPVFAADGIQGVVAAMQQAVLGSLDQTDRECMRRLVGLDKFDVTAVEKLIGLGDGRAMLERLLHLCPLIEEVTGDVGRYSMHPLLRLACRADLCADGHDPDHTALELREADSLETEGDLLGAVERLAHSCHPSVVVRMLRKGSARGEWMGDPSSWLGWLASHPHGASLSRLAVSAGIGQLWMFTDPVRAACELREAVDGFGKAGDLAGQLWSLCALAELAIEHHWSVDDLTPVRQSLDVVLSLSTQSNAEQSLRTWGLAACIALAAQVSAQDNGLAAGIGRVVRLIAEMPDRAVKLRCATLVMHAAPWAKDGVVPALMKDMVQLGLDPAIPPFLRMQWSIQSCLWQLQYGGDMVEADRNLGYAREMLRDGPTLSLTNPLREATILTQACAGRVREAVEHAAEIPAQEHQGLSQAMSRGSVPLAAVLKILSGQVAEGLAMSDAARRDSSQLRDRPIAQSRHLRAMAVACMEIKAYEASRALIESALQVCKVSAEVAFNRRTAEVLQAIDAHRRSIGRLQGEAFLAMLDGLHGHGFEAGLMLAPRLVSQLIEASLTDRGASQQELIGLITRRQLKPALVYSGFWPWPKSVRILGRVDIRCLDVPLGAGGKAQQRLLELLVLLVAAGRGGRSQQFLESNLWADSDNPKAALNVAIHRLRKLLGNDSAVQVQTGQVILDVDHVWTDLHALGEFADHVSNLGVAEREARAAQLGEILLDLYRGPLVGADRDSWLSVCQKRVASRVADLVGTLGTALEAQGLWSQASELYRRVLDAEPLSEVAYRGLMRCAHAQGDLGSAASFFRFCRQTLSILLNCEPSSQTIALAQSLGMNVSSRQDATPMPLAVPVRPLRSASPN